MKKFFAMMLSLLMVFSLVACGAKPNDTARMTPAQTVTRPLIGPPAISK